MRETRREDIAHSIAVDGRDFYCHETTRPSGDGFHMDITSASDLCAGAVIMLEREGLSSQMMRIIERLDPDVDYAAMVERSGSRVWSRAEFVSA